MLDSLITYYSGITLTDKGVSTVLNKPKTSNDGATIREHLANERTFLAWISTSLGIMAFGFVVEKFSVFIKEVAILLGKPTLHQASSALQGSAPLFGIILVVFGILLVMLSFLKFKMIEKQIEQNTYHASSKLNIFLTLLILIIGILLVIYLSINI